MDKIGRLRALEKAVELVEKATPGPWLYRAKSNTFHGPPPEGTNYSFGYSIMDPDEDYPTFKHEDIDALLAAVNFIREHGSALIAELGQEVGAVAWLKELDGGAVKCVPRDFPGAFPVYRESTPLRCKDGQPGDRNRPAQEPGGVECMKCGGIFIGEEWHSVCAVCLDKPGSERLCDFFADVGEVARFMDELCNVVTELTGDEGEDDPITVLRRHIATSPAHTSEARYAVLKGVRELAIKAAAHWDADEDMKVGKILMALAGQLPKYDKRADAFDAALETSR